MLPADFAYYEIHRANNIDMIFYIIGTSITTNFDDLTAVLGNTYCYRVYSVDIYGNKSAPSSDTCVFFSVQGSGGSGGSEGSGGSGWDGTNRQTISNPTAVFSKDNIICVYREGDSESLSVANRYKELYDLDDDQLVSVPCSNIEVLQDYITFQSEVEDPLRAKITSNPVSNRSIYGMVLMPYVPGGFRDGPDVISSTSRLSKIFFPFDKNINNAVYNRQVFKRFDGFDALQSLICTRIDGPSIVTTPWLDNIEIARSRFQVEGSFYLDPYSAYTFRGATDYTDDILDFYSNYSSRLGLLLQKTNQPPRGRDAFFSQIEDDSFFWGWGADRGSLTYFKTSSNTRAFFYNADFNGGFNMRDLDSRSWPILAIREGYISSAGNMSGSDASSFLRPVPFMDALFRGASLGEAFIYSQPLLNSHMACFGDILAVFSFPSSFVEAPLINPNKSWKEMETCFAESIICLYRKTNILKELRNRVAGGNDVVVQEDLDYFFDDLYQEFDETSWKNDYINLSNKLTGFVVDRNATAFDFAYPNLNQYLSYTNTKISQIVLDTFQNPVLVSSIVSSNIETVGSWIFDDILEHYYGDFRFYHIELEVAKSLEDFDLIPPLVSKDTFQDVNNWSFEDYNGDFKPFSTNGITSNYEGKKVRYYNNGSDFLQRGEFYWFRIRQKDELQEFPWRYFRKIIFR